MLSQECSSSLHSLLQAMEQGLTRAKARGWHPMFSSWYCDSVVNIYYRCLHGKAVHMRYHQLEATMNKDAGQAFVLANITVAPEYQGQGFLKELLRRLGSAKSDTYVELENVLNEQLIVHLRTQGAIARVEDASLGAQEIGRSWLLTPEALKGYASRTSRSQDLRPNAAAL